ncbi:vacuolar basic amino acid transporter 2 [Eremomyces bilateralis CBS 781.70]|uniref:Vacuolar basic amino acid transporter 2 n=1 Tax=Eremomyces bilateralis CBS 781.70 TaxID=1392243 RepID=A0A6G1GH48_9PEZI|nr:vacuolar basic amino acid transporter 2 [Eremomyces bilateralis CBS 781.70]KAF1817427.1 vacuolar basic amino acid transporter 2 [Eremomyces bilateralis CBS 781.70]
MRFASGAEPKVMSSSNGQASETSPLLPKVLSENNGELIAPTFDPGAGLAPEGADAFYERDEEEIGNQQDANGGGDDLERQRSNDSSRLKQFQGDLELQKKMKYFLPAVAIGVFLASADQTIIVTSSPKIGTDLHALNNTSWIATAYFLTLTSFQPLYGKLSDIFGRKPCLLFAYVVFGLGCLFCGLSRNMTELIASRAFAGIGGGGMVTVVSIILSDTVPLRERGKWQGYINIIFASGSAAGAPLGGILADSIGWRWSFLIQGPMCFIAFFAVLFAFKAPTRDHSHWAEKLKRVDFLGATFLVLAVFFMMLGLDRGSNVAWADKYTITALALCVPLAGIFLYVEMRVAAEPFAPGHIIFERSLVACYLVNFFAYGGWMATLFYVPLYLQAVLGFTATQAGVMLIPVIVCVVSGSLVGGFYMQRTGRYFKITVVSATTPVFALISIVLFLGVIQTTPLIRSIGIIVSLSICAFPHGVTVTTTLIGLIANAPPSSQAVVTACSYLFRSLGSVFGLSLASTVANASLRTYIARAIAEHPGAAPPDVDPAQLAAMIRQSLDTIAKLDPEFRAVVRQCFALASRNALACQVVFGSFAAVAVWGIREKALSR